jgi:rhodanese-related sulfurtransferase
MRVDKRLALRLLAAMGGSLALLAAAVGTPTRGARRDTIDVAALAGEIEHETDHVTARELAAWIRGATPGLRVLDVRSLSEFAAYHIPSAEHVALSDIAKLSPKSGETLVLYSEGGAHAAQAWVLLRASGHQRVYFLRGGLLDWMDDVMSPIVSGDSAASVAALSRYFGGVPRAAGDEAVPLRNATAASPRDSRIDAVARVRRRGC